jgi:hypothetical protein
MDWWAEAESGEITTLFNKSGYNLSVHHSFANVEYMVGTRRFNSSNSRLNLSRLCHGNDPTCPIQFPSGELKVA